MKVRNFTECSFSLVEVLCACAVQNLCGQSSPRRAAGLREVVGLRHGGVHAGEAAGVLGVLQDGEAGGARLRSVCGVGPADESLATRDVERLERHAQYLA